MIKYRTAVILTGIFVIVGAYLNGKPGVENLGTYGYNSGITTGMAAFLVLLSAGISCTVMTVLKMPISTSQAIVGSIIGWGAACGQADWSATTKFASAWIATPICSIAVCYLLCKLSEKVVNGRIQSLAAFDTVIKIGYFATGIFGAYSLGANNVANATGIYTGKLGLLSTDAAVLIGGAMIAIGAITYGKRVMYTVGARITTLSPLTGVIVVLSSALTIFLFALIGIPISTTQATVGAVIGAGLVKGTHNVDFKVLRNIFLAWFGTPTIAGLFTFLFGLVYFHFVVQ
jgi:PiT family inorganic phosphate transporter